VGGKSGSLSSPIIKGVFPICSRASVACAFLALLAGCQNFAGIVPGTKSSELVQRFGKPDAVWRNSDGSETWEYLQGPLGRQTYIVTLGMDHAVREVRQVLSDEYFAKVTIGMSRDDVRRLLGKPNEIVVFPARNEEVWSWRYEEQDAMLFHVLFDRNAGTVRTTLREDEGLSQPDE
jgi:hypothetical protein